MSKETQQPVIKTGAFNQAEWDRVSQFDPLTWTDQDGNLIAPMRSEVNQEEADRLSTEALLASRRK